LLLAYSEAFLNFSSLEEDMIDLLNDCWGGCRVVADRKQFWVSFKGFGVHLVLENVAFWNGQLLLSLFVSQR
jgi:hypothetical protein